MTSQATSKRWLILLMMYVTPPALALADDGPSGPFEAQLHPCPMACSTSQDAGWTAYHSVDRLTACHQPMLLSVHLHNALDDPSTSNKILACTIPEANTMSDNTGNATATTSSASVPIKARRTSVPKRKRIDPGICDIASLATVQTELVALSIREGRFNGTGGHTIARDTLSPVIAILRSQLQDAQNCNQPVMFAYNLEMAAAVYTGPFTDQSSSLSAVSTVHDHMSRIAQGSTDLLAQTCGIDRSALNMIGVALSHGKDALARVQAAAAAWTSGQCTDVRGQQNEHIVSIEVLAMPLTRNTDRAGISSGLPMATQSPSASRHSSGSRNISQSGIRSSSTGVSPSSEGIFPLTERSRSSIQQSGGSSSTISSLSAVRSNKMVSYGTAVSSVNGTVLRRHARLSERHHTLERRDDCSTTTVQSGDGCYAVAQRCGITQDQLQQYNSDPNFCNDLQTGQTVCCSSGSLPSTGPQENSDGTCVVELVQSGDSCGSLASRCGITPNNFMTYNPQSNLCSSLQVKERVCCSPGSLPDITPKQNGDGSCFVYTVQPDDTCSAVAMSYGMQPSDISNYNDKTTWGWNGCADIQIGTKICLSSGSPPFPASVNGAVCGPIVPGTTQPSSSNANDWANLNPCPLNACCDIFGFCGTTPLFCTATEGATGNPGTAPPGQPGCVSNCGTDIISSSQPSSQMSIGYYEAWNPDRSCLVWDVEDIGTLRSYTHVHWSFATIDPNSYDIVLNDSYSQFDSFQASTKFKRVLSIGGWGFSTSPATYDVLRQAMNPENVDTFVANIMKFLQSTNIDGIDFDWEYPGAPDIPGIPAGLATDGPNYLNMLRKLRWAVAISGVPFTISIAAPASFWYLRGFPIADMHPLLDYIVYETYDLHGQWDFGNKWSQEGCDDGNCLRSHVNLTETNYALAMITKAGVPANKIAVGVASYGRAFGMTDQTCTGPECTFQGPDSTAQPGQCTGVAGYISNAEIESLIYADGLSPQYDQGSDSITMVYGDTWVSYMDNNTINSRINYYQGFGFAGSSEWAIDLSTWSPDNGVETSTDGGSPSTGSIGSGTDDTGFVEKSRNVGYGFRDQRHICQDLDLQGFQNAYYRVYEDCYYPGAAQLQPQVTNTSQCVVKQITDVGPCQNGCIVYQILQEYPYDDSGQKCNFYLQRFQRYLVGFVQYSSCVNNYWQCVANDQGNTAIQIVLTKAQPQHVNSMLNDMFDTVQQARCY